MRVTEAVTRYTSTVQRIAAQMIRRMPASVDLNDLVQAGMVGLLDAAKKFDDSKGGSFATYAGIRIHGSIIDDLRKGDRVPRSVHLKYKAAAEATCAVEARTGAKATGIQIAKEMGVDINTYHAEVRDAAEGFLLSFEDVLRDDDWAIKSVAGEVPESYDFVQNAERTESVAEAIRALPDRERRVVTMYYYQEVNLKEIGEVLGVGESRICQIVKSAKESLRIALSPYNWGN